MYYYDDTRTLLKMIYITIAVVIIGGIALGVASGISLTRPSAGAIKATQELQENSGYYYGGYKNRLEERAEEKKWTTEGTVTMLSIWGISFVAGLLLFTKAHQIKMTDDMCLYLSEIVDEIEKKKKARAKMAEKKAET